MTEKIRKKEEKQRERLRLGLRFVLPNLIDSTAYNYSEKFSLLLNRVHFVVFVTLSSRF